MIPPRADVARHGIVNFHGTSRQHDLLLDSEAAEFRLLDLTTERAANTQQPRYHSQICSFQDLPPVFFRVFFGVSSNRLK